MRIPNLVALLLLLFTVACINDSEDAGGRIDEHPETAAATESVQPAYFVFNYEIRNRDAYAPYLMQVRETLEAYGAEIVVADFESDAIEGAAGEVTVVLRFASREIALDWYQSPQYQEIIELRTSNSVGIASLASAADN